MCNVCWIESRISASQQSYLAPNERKFYLDRSPEPGFSKHVVSQFDLWHLRRGARYGRNVDDEPSERFAALFVFDVYRGFVAFFLFYPAGGRTR